jgi:hypothetical protein
MRYCIAEANEYLVITGAGVEGTLSQSHVYKRQLSLSQIH